MERLAAVFDSESVHAVVAAATHPGRRRSENQDNFLISELGAEDDGTVLRPLAGESEASAAGRLQLGQRGALLLVADGMGGAAAGRLASGLVCSFILAELQEGWRTESPGTSDRFALRIREAVEKANRRVHEHALRNPECTGMGTTATVAGILGRAACIAQVGDSRAYLLRNGTATQLTHDQSVLQQMVDSGAMTLEEAERSAHGNLILQAVGVEPEIAVELTLLDLQRGDRLVLCSDGIHRLVPAHEILSIVDRAAEPGSACDELVALANSRGGPDNITVVIARLDGDGLPEPQASNNVARMPMEPRQREDDRPS